MIQQMLAIWSAFSKTTLNIWKFMIHILLKPGMENFEHFFVSIWDECNFMVVWAFFGISFFEIGMKSDHFQLSHGWDFQISCHIEYITFAASSMRIWNSSTGIKAIIEPPVLQWTLHWLSEQMRSTAFSYNNNKFSQLENFHKPLVPPHSLGGDYPINSNDNPPVCRKQTSKTAI